MSSKKFRISCLVLFLVLLSVSITEGILRLNSPKLFIPAGSNLLKVNPKAAQKYSLNSENLNSALISKQKEDNTFRVFVIGTTSYSMNTRNLNASYAHILTSALQKTFPEKNIEIINLSSTLPSSEVQCHVAEQVKKYEADAVIISPGYCSAHEKVFSSLRTVQEANRLFRDDKVKIPDSHSHKKSLYLFEKNLDKMVYTLQQENVPVFLVNKINNFDIPPKETGFTSPNAIHLQKLYDRGKAAYLQKDVNVAYACFSAINKREKFHAATNFYLGRIALSRNDYVTAEKMLTRAVELDRSDNRIPREINQIILKVSTVRDCHLVNVAQAFVKHSEHGLPGNELFSGHEFNLEGNIVMARECYESVLKHCQVKDTDFHFEHSLTLFDKLYDQLYSEKSFSGLGSGIYCTQVIDSFAGKTASAFAENQLSWEESMNALYENYIRNKNYKMALKIIENLALENPYNVSINNCASQTASLLGDSQLVVHYAKKVYNMKPDAEVAQRLFISYLKLDMPEKALPYIVYAQNHRKDLNLIYKATCQVIDLKKLLQREPGNNTIKMEIAQHYKSIGNEEVALSYLEKSNSRVFYH